MKDLHCTMCGGYIGHVTNRMIKTGNQLCAECMIDKILELEKNKAQGSTKKEVER